MFKPPVLVKLTARRSRSRGAAACHWRTWIDIFSRPVTAPRVLPRGPEIPSAAPRQSRPRHAITRPARPGHRPRPPSCAMRRGHRMLMNYYPPSPSALHCNDLHGLLHTRVPAKYHASGHSMPSSSPRSASSSPPLDVMHACTHACIPVCACMRGSHVADHMISEDTQQVR